MADVLRDLCWDGCVRARYERVAGLGAALDRARELSARTVIFDVEPLVAYWDSGRDALDRGLELVVGQVGAVPGVQVVCFATNSARRPSRVLGWAGVRIVYLASAGKPVRTESYRSFPQPGVVVGDQVATDGILAWRLGYAFVRYRPPNRIPAGPRVMNGIGCLMRPLLFTRPG